KLSIRHLESSYELVSQINSKGFQGVFSMFLHHKHKKMLVNFTNIKKYRVKRERGIAFSFFFVIQTFMLYKSH
ncbi:MAG: hypothetical protein E6869_13055, partial [Enterococcus hirae]|nr:hypothetical protein [Enterococcus hirae]